MMKWKKDRASASASSSSHHSLITHVFPVSWFSKFKQKNLSSHQYQATTKAIKHKGVGKQDLPSPSLSVHSSGLKEGRFYSREDDPYWRLSFSEDRIEGEKSTATAGRNSFSSASINELEVPFSRIVDPMVNGKTKSPSQLRKIYSKSNQKRKSKGTTCLRVQVWRKAIQFQRRRRKHGVKAGAYSPRTVAKIECKIKALEDMKRSKMKMRKKMKEKDRTAFDSFAVVKSSFNPEQDFKDSMVEMITQIGIKQPEELEELLACYLTLNCDQYHHIIINVFRQVWFELNQAYVSAHIQSNFCCDHLHKLT